MSTDREQIEKILERLAAQETNMEWVVRHLNDISEEVEQLRKDLERRFAKLRWEITGGILILVLLQILLNLLK